MTVDKRSHTNLNEYMCRWVNIYIYIKFMWIHIHMYVCIYIYIYIYILSLCEYIYIYVIACITALTDVLGYLLFFWSFWIHWRQTRQCVTEQDAWLWWHFCTVIYVYSFTIAYVTDLSDPFVYNCFPSNPINAAVCHGERVYVNTYSQLQIGWHRILRLFLKNCQHTKIPHMELTISTM